MAVSEAARKNLPVAAHCIGGQGLKDCIDGGYRSLSICICAPRRMRNGWQIPNVLLILLPVFSWIRRARNPVGKQCIPGSQKPAARPGKTEASDEYRCSVCSGNRCLPWLSVPRGWICGRARFRYCDRIKGCYLQCREGLRTGRPDRKLKERLCCRYHCSGWKSADGCGVPGKRTVCNAGW